MADILLAIAILSILAGGLGWTIPIGLVCLAIWLLMKFTQNVQRWTQKLKATYRNLMSKH